MLGYHFRCHMIGSSRRLQDSNVDLFEKKAEEKKERVAKNELQRLRNLARASGMKKVPGIGATPSEKPSKLELGRQFVTAKKVGLLYGFWSRPCLL